MSEIVCASAIPGEEEYDNSCCLPTELWVLILSFLDPYEEFPVARVCKLFYEILSAKRAKRNHVAWETDITPFCINIETIESSLFYHFQCDILDRACERRIAHRLIQLQNYDTLIELASRYRNVMNYYLYDKLAGQKAYSTIREIIDADAGIPHDFIEIAVNTGQLDLVQIARRNNPGFYPEGSLLLAAIETRNLEIIKIIYQMVSTNRLRLLVCMSECVKTNDLEIVQFAHTTLRAICDNDCFNIALANNPVDVEIIRYLIDIGCPISEKNKIIIDGMFPYLTDFISADQIEPSGFWE